MSVAIVSNQQQEVYQVTAIKQSLPVNREMFNLHMKMHEQWRWYGVSPALQRLYQLWAEIGAEDQARAAHR